MRNDNIFPFWPLIVFAIIGGIVLCVCVVSHGDERDECQRLAPKYNATTEAPLWDLTRVDLLNAEFAIEADWPHKWAEAVGQSLYYAELTGRKPAIILLVSDRKAQARYIYRCQTVCARAGIKLYIEKVEPTPAKPPAVFIPPAALPQPLQLPAQQRRASLGLFAQYGNEANPGGPDKPTGRRRWTIKPARTLDRPPAAAGN